MFVGILYMLATSSIIINQNNWKITFLPRKNLKYFGIRLGVWPWSISVSPFAAHLMTKWTSSFILSPSWASRWKVSLWAQHWDKLSDLRWEGQIPLLLLDQEHGFPSWLSCIESACNAGDAGKGGSIPGLGRSPGRGHCNPLQYSCLENRMDRGTWQYTAHGVAKSQTGLKRLNMCVPPRTWLVCLTWWPEKGNPRSPFTSRAKR